MVMNESQARVVDPVLTTQSRGYSAAGMVAPLLFPFVTVNQMGGKRIEFGKESFLKMNTVRAPGATTKQIQFGYEGKAFALNQHRVEAKAPKEYTRAAGVPGINVLRRGVRGIQDVEALEMEVEAANLALDENNYAASNRETLSGSDQWSHDDSVPQEVVDDAKEAIRVKAGVHPNTMILPPKIFLAARKNLHIKSHFTSSVAPNPTIDVGKLQDYFGVKRIAVGERTYVDTLEGDFKDVWDGGVVLAYVPENDGDGSHEVPSYGYTYRLNGNPVVEKTEWDRGTQSWLTAYEDNYEPHIVGPDSGFLIQGVL